MSFETQGDLDSERAETVRLIKVMEQTGNYKFMQQQSGQTSVEVDGQEVQVPFTNMEGKIILLVREDDGQWKYTVSFDSFDAPDLAIFVRSKK